MTAGRRLAAILATDVVGYSRLMGDDEEGTLEALRKLRAEVIEPKIAEHQGRLFKSMGDGFLVEFPSVVNAVACAAVIQKAMAARTADQPQDQQLQLRIGVHLGDVISEGGDVYGDGVNVAARIEGLAPPGGVAVSAMVHDNVGSRLDLSFEDMGEQQLKNIAKPLRVYHLVASTRPAAAAAERTKPSIAVLPFTNMSGDGEQEYFSDGLTEDIITELSRFKGLHVAARNSSFAFKGKSSKIADVGRELGVQFVLEGSVRKAGNRVRVTGQLIDVLSGGHIWAERYDRDISDIFALQDEVVRAIVGAVPGQLDRHAVDVSRRKPPASLTAFDYLLRGRWALWNGPDVGVAIENLDKALVHDSDYALAHAHAAYAHAYARFFLGVPADQSDKLAVDHATRAVRLNAYDPEILYAVSIAFIMSVHWDQAEFYSRRAVELNPGDPSALQVRGLVLTYLGRHDEALEHFDRSAALSPYAADDWRNEHLCDCLYMRREFKRFFAICRNWLSAPAHMKLEVAAAHALLGQGAEALQAMDEFAAATTPKPDAATFAQVHARMCKELEDRELWLEGYRKAGIET